MEEAGAEVKHHGAHPAMKAKNGAQATKPQEHQRQTAKDCYVESPRHRQGDHRLTRTKSLAISISCLSSSGLGMAWSPSSTCGIQNQWIVQSVFENHPLCEGKIRDSLAPVRGLSEQRSGLKVPAKVNSDVFHVVDGTRKEIDLQGRQRAAKSGPRPPYVSMPEPVV